MDAPADTVPGPVTDDAEATRFGQLLDQRAGIADPARPHAAAEAIRAGVGIYQMQAKVLNCHGWGSCGECRVNIVKGMENTSPRGLKERIRMFFSMAYVGSEKTMRLACQTRVHGDVEVQTKPPLNLFGENFFS